MKNQDTASVNDASARSLSVLITDIVKAAAQISAQKLGAGQEVLKKAVSFAVIDRKPTKPLERVRRHLGAKVERATLGWLVGPMKRPATSAYVDNKGRIIMTTAFGRPRMMSEVTIVTPELLKTMNSDEVNEIHTLLVKVHS